MKAFEYARPTTEEEAVTLLAEQPEETAILAGGTDLVSLMRQELVTPSRVVDIKEVDSFRSIEALPDGGVKIGTTTTLEEMQDSPLLADYTSLKDVIDGIRSIQIQSMGTLGGDLCHLPNCWYFRNGYGLLGMNKGRSLVQEGDNRYHAILGNSGVAKYVSATRFAPALIAWEASVRIIGPAGQERIVSLESIYGTPKLSSQGILNLEAGELISHILLPPPQNYRSATYEVLQLEGLDWPLAAAAATLQLQGRTVTQAKIVMGHTAPTPWSCPEVADFILGREITEELADQAGELAVAQATPLSNNSYKVQLAKTAVKRALQKAAGLSEGGL